MPGPGDSWGTREELLHPRDKRGRFRKTWKMAQSAIDAITNYLSGFNPRTFQSDGQASQYLFNRAKPSRFGGGSLYPRLHGDYDEANEHLRSGDIDAPTQKFIKMMDDSSIELEENVILSRTVGADAFGLTPEQLGLEEGGLEDYTGWVIADRGYSAANIGTPLSHGPGKVTMVISTPKGTKAIIPARSQNDRGIFLDRDQHYAITKVESDGRGGFYMMAVAVPGAGKEAPEPTERGPRGAGLTPEQREARIKGIQDLQAKRQGIRSDAEINAEEIQRGTQQGLQDQPAQLPPAQGRPAAPGEPPPRNEPILKESVGGADTEGKGTSEIAETPPPEPPPAPEAPAPVRNFREVAQEANLPVPSPGKRRVQWNNAYGSLTAGRKDPGDVLRELDSDVAFFKHRQADNKKSGLEDPSLEDDIAALEQLADAIAGEYGLERSKPAAPTERRRELPGELGARKVTNIKQFKATKAQEIRDREERKQRLLNPPPEAPPPTKQTPKKAAPAKVIPISKATTGRMTLAEAKKRTAIDAVRDNPVKGEHADASYKNILRNLESGEWTPARARQEALGSAKYFRRSAEDAKGFGRATPEQRDQIQNENNAIADKYEKLAEELLISGSVTKTDKYRNPEMGAPKKAAPATKSLMSQMTPEERKTARQFGLPDDHPLARMAERISSANSEAEVNDLLRDVHPDDVNQLGKELGIPFPADMGAADRKTYIARNITSFGTAPTTKKAVPAKVTPSPEAGRPSKDQLRREEDYNKAIEAGDADKAARIRAADEQASTGKPPSGEDLAKFRERAERQIALKKEGLPAKKAAPAAPEAGAGSDIDRMTVKQLQITADQEGVPRRGRPTNKAKLKEAILANRAERAGALAEQESAPPAEPNAPAAQKLIQAPDRREAFAEDWLNTPAMANINEKTAAGRSILEVRDDVASGKLTPDEGIRRIETDIELNKADLADVEQGLRGDIDPAERARLQGDREKLRKAISDQENTSSFMRKHFRKAPAVTPKEIEMQLDPQTKEAIDNATPEQMREAAKIAGYGDVPGDTKEEILQNTIKKIIAKELDEKKAAKKLAPAPLVTKKSGDPDYVDARAIAEGLDMDESDQKMLAHIQHMLDGTGNQKVNTPAAAGRYLEKWANGPAGPAYKAAVISGVNRDREGNLTPELQREYDESQVRFKRWMDLAGRLQKTRRRPARKATEPAPEKPKLSTPEKKVLADAAEVLDVPKETLQKQALAKKVAAAPPPEAAKSVVEQLGKMESREEGAKFLERRTKAELQDILRASGVPAPSKDNKAELTRKIVDINIAGRLQFKALTQGTPLSERQPEVASAPKVEPFKVVRDQRHATINGLPAYKHAEESKDLNAEDFAAYLDRYKFTKPELAEIGSRQDSFNPLYRDEPFRIERNSHLKKEELRQKLIDDRRNREAARAAVTDPQRATADWLEAEAAKWPEGDPDARNGKRAIGRVADAIRGGFIDEDGATHAIETTALRALRRDKYQPQMQLAERLRERIETPAPKPKTPSPGLPQDTPRILARLNAVDANNVPVMSREEVGELIAPLKKARLVEIAKTYNIPGVSNKTIPELRQWIIDASVGNRLDSIAVRGFTGARPDDSGSGRPLESLRPSELAELEEELGIKRTSLDRMDRVAAIRARQAAKEQSAGMTRSLPASGRKWNWETIQEDNMTMHGDSASMELAQKLRKAGREEDAQYVADMRYRISNTRGEHSPDDVEKMVSDLKAMMGAEQDPALKAAYARALEDIEAPQSPAPDLPASTPPALRRMMDELNQIPAARRSGHFAGTTKKVSAVDRLAELIRKVETGQVGSVGTVESEIRSILRSFHESVDGAFQMWRLEGLMEDRGIATWVRSFYPKT